MFYSIIATHQTIGKLVGTVCLFVGLKRQQTLIVLQYALHMLQLRDKEFMWLL